MLNSKSTERGAYLLPWLTLIISIFIHHKMVAHDKEEDRQKTWFYPGMFWGGGSSSKTYNFSKNFCHVGNYNLNIEATK